MGQEAPDIEARNDAEAPQIEDRTPTNQEPASAAPILARAKAHRVGPHSRPSGLAKLDRRTWAARLMAGVRGALITHLGGSPSAVERALIDRIAILTLHVAMFDQRALAKGEPLSERDSRAYLAYSNSLSRSLSRLGTKGAPAPTPTLEDLLAEMAADKEREANAP